ncbi:hypothetical protein GPECTOR_3g3 [Gonium pectorale]|uniref:Uncharacterized protein n=1 Tax=Gonium pectorale TaxID=33097 RepID=A0A150H0R2_GONPE|nr:hypothetical protein GPECTOR_3g3 [Gonium pectorale]|eukprot:KXZ55150.1 hypothetical protein GPECTOR_3g3 [Gonium pectorale]
MPIVDELEKLGKSGMKVTERYTTQDGHKVVREFMHYVFVSTCLADIPAKNKVGDFRGVGSKVGSCSYCLFEGQPIPGRTGKGSVTRYLGARGMELLAGDPKIALSHQDLIKRGHKLRNAHLRVVRCAMKIKAGSGATKWTRRLAALKRVYKAKSIRHGCWGMNPFFRLWYLNALTFHVVSISHAFYHGICKGFSGLMLDRYITAAGKKIISQRGQSISVPSDFGRRYRDWTIYWASYKMEEWAHFVETFSAYLFDGDVLPGPVKGLWFLLIDIVEHYFRPRPDEETRDEFELASRKAYDQLRHFAAGLEELESGADYMMTTNLHIVVCRLHRQELELGTASAFNDLPVERVMQTMKSDGGRMVTQSPEKVYAQRLLTARNAEALADKNGKITCKALADKNGKITCVEQFKKMEDVEAAVTFMLREIPGQIGFDTRVHAEPESDPLVPKKAWIDSALLGANGLSRPTVRLFSRAESDDETRYFSEISLID